MGDFKKNPKEPFEIRVPNKIRKRIVMHGKESSFLDRLESVTKLRKVLRSPPTPVVKKRGSLWSRFTNRVKKFLITH